MVLESLFSAIEALESRPDTSDWVSDVFEWRNRYPILEKGAEAEIIMEKRERYEHDRF